MKKRYEHYFALPFTIQSEHPEGDDLTSDDFKKAIEARIADLDSSGEIAWQECMGMPDETVDPEDDLGSVDYCPTCKEDYHGEVCLRTDKGEKL